MMILDLATIFISCSLLPSVADGCVFANTIGADLKTENVAGISTTAKQAPKLTTDSLDVELSAKAAIVWDESSGEILYKKNIDVERPVASIIKILTALVVRNELNPDSLIEIPPDVRKSQRQGANVNLPIGEHLSVHDLLLAGLVASANDAMISLALGVTDSEQNFAQRANKFAKQNGFYSTRMSTATGLDGGDQYATARDVMGFFRLAYHDKLLRSILVENVGEIRTKEGSYRRFESTNKLLGTYFTVLAGKTGYTPKAGQNLVVMTEGVGGQQIGAAVLGSDNRFYDMKVLVEWIWRNYNWSK